MNGPYTVLLAVLIGSFLFAALYHAALWAYSRRDKALLWFSLHMLTCAAVSGVLLVLTTTTHPEIAARAFAWRTTFTCLLEITLVWLLALVARVRARPFVWTTTAVFGVATLVSIVLPIAGRVTGLHRITTPWNESLTGVSLTAPTPLAFLLVAMMLGVNLFGVYAARRMWPRDPVGACLVALSSIPYLVVAVWYLDPNRGSRSVYMGSIPYATMCFVMAFQLARRRQAGVLALRRTHSALQQGEKRYRMLVENQPDPLIEWLPAGEITFGNEALARFLHVARDESPPRMDAILEQASWHALQEGISELTADAPVAEGEYQVAVGGTTRYLHLRSKGTFDAAGKVTSLQSTGQDRTAAHEAEEARRRLEGQLTASRRLQLVGQLAGGIAHDFNNLLTVINGYSEMLLSDASAGSQRSDIEEIHRAGGRAAALTQQLLEFSGRTVGDVSVFDANSILLDAEKMLRRVIGSDIVLAMQVSAQPAWLKSDPSQFERVLMNLVINARDAMPDGGTITVRTSVDPAPASFAIADPGTEPRDVVTMIVSDTGTGMSADVRTRLFEPFFTTKATGRGTGLGLAVVDGFVRHARGQIEVESTLGRGTTFCLRLPRATGEAAAATTGAPSPATRRRPAETILIVDDDDAVRGLVTSVLTREGYTVRAFADGVEALQSLEAGVHPDLVLTDVVMPGMGGGALAASIRQVSPRIPMLFMSGYTLDEAVHRGVEADEADLLFKPFTVAGLIARVREVIDRGARRV